MRLLIEEEAKKQMTIDYAMEHLWLVTNAVYVIGGGELKTPRYLQLTHPEMQFEDTRTADEIINDTINGL